MTVIAASATTTTAPLIILFQFFFYSFLDHLLIMRAIKNMATNDF